MIKIIKEKIPKDELKRILENSYKTFFKVAVDIEKEILAAGGEWHSEEQDMLVKQEKSDASTVWGANFHPFEIGDRRIEYISLINLKSHLGNRKMAISDSLIRDKIKSIIEKLLLNNNETFE